ncbi:MAG TPA: hypothetical protein VGA49_01990 [Patescibacteria group bacterium]
MLKHLKQILILAIIIVSFGLAGSALAQNVTVNNGDLIKGGSPAVYYYLDGQRFVFPNEKIFKSWFADFTTVKIIPDEQLAAIQIGGNITYRPGARLIKIISNPKVYAVEPGGLLRWVKTEELARLLFGDNWALLVDDLPESFFVN